MDSLLKSIDTVRNQRKVAGSVSALSRCPVPVPVLLNQTTYPLNKSKTKFVSAGLRHHSAFVPIIQIYGLKNNWVSFDEAEWKLLVENQTFIANYFTSRDPHFAPIHINSKTITFQCIGLKKVVGIRDQCSSEVYMGIESLCELWELVHLIEHRLEILKSFDFFQFYSSVIKGVADIPGDVKTNIETVLVPVMQTHSANAYSMLEMLKFVEEIVIADVDMENIIPQMMKGA